MQKVILTDDSIFHLRKILNFNPKDTDIKPTVKLLWILYLIDNDLFTVTIYQNDKHILFSLGEWQKMGLIELL